MSVLVLMIGAGLCGILVSTVGAAAVGVGITYLGKAADAWQAARKKLKPPISQRHNSK